MPLLVILCLITHHTHTNKPKLTVKLLWIIVSNLPVCFFQLTDQPYTVSYEEEKVFSLLFHQLYKSLVLSSPQRKIAFHPFPTPYSLKLQTVRSKRKKRFKDVTLHLQLFWGPKPNSFQPFKERENCPLTINEISFCSAEKFQHSRCFQRNLLSARGTAPITPISGHILLPPPIKPN